MVRCMNVHRQTNSQLRDFGLLMAFALTGVFGTLLPWWRGTDVRPILILGGLLFGTLGVFTPATLAPAFRLWMHLGHILGWINSRIILGFIFFLLFSPLALVMRLWGRDPMHRHLDGAAKCGGSYRVTPKGSHSTMENPY